MVVAVVDDKNIYSPIYILLCSIILYLYGLTRSTTTTTTTTTIL